MKYDGRRSNAQRIAAAVFVILFLVIPIALLTSIPIGILVEILLAFALLGFGASFLASDRFRGPRKEFFFDRFCIYEGRQ